MAEDGKNTAQKTDDENLQGIPEEQIEAHDQPNTAEDMREKEELITDSRAREKRALKGEERPPVEVTSKIKGLERLLDAEKNNARIQKLTEVMEKDELLRAVFLSDDPVQALGQKGIKVSGINELRKIVHESLEVAGDRSRAMSLHYRPKQSLTVQAFDLHAIEPDWLPEFADDLRDRLEKAATVIVPVVAEGVKAETNPDKLSEEEDGLYQKLRNDPDFNLLIFMIRMLSSFTDELPDEAGKKAYEESLEKYFGTRDAEVIRKKIRAEGDESPFRFIRDKAVMPHGSRGPANEEFIFKCLLAPLDTEKNVTSARHAIREAVRKLQSYRVTASAATPKPEKEEKPEAAPKPVEEAHPLTADQKRVLAVIQETGDISEEIIRKRTGLQGSKLWKILGALETIGLIKSAEPATKTTDEVADKPQALSEVKTYLISLARKNASLKKRLETIFEILEANPANHPKEKRYLEAIQRQMSDILLVQLPLLTEGMEKCGNFEELLGQLERVYLTDQQAGMSKLATFLDENDSLRDIVDTFYEITDRRTLADKMPAEQTPEPGKGASETPFAETPETATLQMSEALKKLIQTFSEAETARLKKLWLIRAGKAEFKDGDQKKAKRVKRLMTQAQYYADQYEEKKESGHLEMAKDALRDALNIKGNIVSDGGSEPPPDNTGPTGPSGGGSEGGAKVTRPNPISATPVIAKSAPAPEEPKIHAEPASAQAAPEGQKVNYRFLIDKPGIITEWLGRLGCEHNPSLPVSVAIHEILMEKILRPEELEKLKAFLKRGKNFEDIDEFIGGRNLKQLEGELELTEARLDEIGDKIREANWLRMSAESGGNKDRSSLHREKRQLESQKVRLKEGIQRLKERKGEETKYYQNKPEKLLGMINLYFASLGLPEGETPNYEKILEDSQKQIDAAREKSINFYRKAYRFLNPLNYLLKPTLTGTLEAIIAKDDSFKKIKPEQVQKLTKVWDNPRGVETWIHNLEGSEEENMRTVVPVLIAHLEHAVNPGGFASYLNTLSIERTKELIKNLRLRVHRYSIEHTEKSAAKKNLERMEIYFGQLNQINREAEKVSNSLVSRNMWKVAGIRSAKAVGVAAVAGGIGAGGIALASLSGLTLAGASLASAGGVALGSSFRVKDPKTKQFLRHAAVRGLAAGGLGTLALGTVPWLAIPAMTAGFISPEALKYRASIARGTAKGAPKVAKAGWWATKTSVKVGWGYVGAIAGLASLGLAFTNSRFNRFFGLHKLGLPG